MCGRYARRGGKQKIAEAFALSYLDQLSLETASFYNVAPTTMQPELIGPGNFRPKQMLVFGWFR